LGTAIFSQDEQKLKNYPRRLRAANVGLNQMVSSDPRLPFGGFADSGWGKELGKEGIRSFTLAQTIVRP
ncbi:MAG: aldehyde dehydrogenase family protein, partial [Bacteroidota bacterium]